VSQSDVKEETYVGGYVAHLGGNVGAREVCHATAASLASFNQHELNEWLNSGARYICNII
jgi:hypothetical protein